MSLGKFGNKLKKELARNKAKSAALGAVCLVAMFFWGPLLASWFGDGTTEAVEPEPAPINASAPDQTFTAPAAPNKSARAANWSDILKLIQDDNLMLSAELSKSQIDPFRSFAHAEAKFEPQVETIDIELTQIEEASSVPETTDSNVIQRLQISLESVLIGGRERRAKINGHHFGEFDLLLFDRVTGRMLEDDAEAQGTRLPIQFELAEIQPKHIVLKSGELERKIQLKRIDFRSSSQKQTNRK